MMTSILAVALRLSSADRPVLGTGPAQGDELDKAVQKRPVLIVEDEAMIAWTLESLLEDMGFTEITVVASGADALEQAARIAPKLILSDVNLGTNALDGIAATAEIVAGTPAAVVFITAFASVDARQRISRDVPGAVLLRKPVDGATLRRAIVQVTKPGGTH